MLSGRLGFELVQKAVTAGVPVVAAVSAPSSLALDVAARFGVTAVAFAREGRASVYTHPARVATA
jgi:FdhD protein